MLRCTLLLMVVAITVADHDAPARRKVRAAVGGQPGQRLVQRVGETLGQLSRRVVVRLGLNNTAFALPAAVHESRNGWALYRLTLQSNQAAPSSLAKVTQRGVLRRGVTEGVDLSSWDPFVVSWRGLYRHVHVDSLPRFRRKMARWDRFGDDSFKFP